MIKLQTKITSLQDVEKSLREIEKVFNDLTKSVNSKAESEITDKEGKTGDLQVTMNEDKSYTFEFKTETGWKTPIFQENVITFKDKPAQINQPKKSIDELEADDTNTGDSKAKKTIFDEKASKFILPRPDYESDWLAANRNTTVTVSHGLNLSTTPTLIQVYISNTANPVVRTDFIASNYGVLNANWGYMVKVKDKDTILVFIGDDGGLYYPGDNYFGAGGVGENVAEFANGYVKLKIWK